MFLRFVIFFLCFTLRAFAFSRVSSYLPRDVAQEASDSSDPASSNIAPSSSSATTPDPAINATITDHDGQDITSSFQIMLYHEPPIPAIGNLTSRQATLSRPINHCAYGVFRESFCTPQNNISHSLQSYRIICDYVYYVTGRFVPDQAVGLTQRDGHCEDDEICVPGLGPAISRTGRRMASCVKKFYFIKYLNRGDNGQRSFNLSGMYASMMVSNMDGTVPEEVDMFDTEAGAESSGPVQSEKCRDCMALTTHPFAVRTEDLKAEVRMLRTGMIAGILWLAILSV